MVMACKEDHAVLVLLGAPQSTKLQQQNTTMYGQHRKLDPLRVLTLKHQGLSNKQIAQRLGVTSGAIYHVLCKFSSKAGHTNNSPRFEPCEETDGIHAPRTI